MKSKIQSVLIPKSKSKSKLHAVNFPKDGFTLKQSHKWLLDHDFKLPKKVDETTNFFRYRQKLPDKRYTYTTKILPNGVELVLMWKKPIKIGGATRIKKLEHPTIDMTDEMNKRKFNEASVFKSYQLKDLIRQFVEDPTTKEKYRNINYKTLPKKKLIELYIRYKIAKKRYIAPEKNPIIRVPTDVLKRIGLKKNTDEEQKLLIDEMQKINPIKVITNKKVKDEKLQKGELTLQDHQEKFIKQFVFSQLRGAIVFHGVGSGKTLTAVVSSYFYLTLYPNNKVIVISPSALLYNFINGMVQYGIDPKDKRYEYLTYEKYIRKPIVAKNCLLIIDEAHNFRTEIIQQVIKDPETDEVLETSASKNKRGFTIMKYGAFEAHKVLLLTGTAFVNTIYDIENLLAFVDKRYPLDKKAFFESVAIPSNLEEYFGYRISYVPTQKSIYFPEKREFIIPVYMTEKQEAEYNELKLTGNPNNKNSSENPNAYYSAERYATNAIQQENNPKINKIVELLEEKPHQKFIIYTVAQDAGIKLLEKKLTELNIGYKIISGKQTAAQKEESKKYFNGYYTSGYVDINNKLVKLSEDEKNNDWEAEYYIDKSENPSLKPYINDKYRVLLITKAGAEGVDTVNCQNLVLLDHQWNDATTQQIIARAVRFKSHYALPESEQYVNIYTLLFCFSSEKPIVDKISKEGFNDWVNVKTELNAESNDYKQTKNIIIKVKNKGLTLQKQFMENKKLQNADVNTLLNYYLKVIDKIKKYSIEQIPELKNKFEEMLNYEINAQQEFIKNARQISGQIITIHHKGIRAMKNSKKAYDENINYYDKIKKNILSISKIINRIIDDTEGFGDLEAPPKGSIDLYLFILSKAKLKNINEFILNFGGNISLFESFESKLLPIIQKAEEEMIKKNKRGLTDVEQVEIYKEALSKEKDAILNFNFSIDPKRIIAKAGRDAEDKYQQFYTSELLAERMKELGLKDLKGNIDILEPTAGFGNLIKPLIKELKTEFHIDMIDIDERNRNELKKLVKIAPNILNLLDNKNFLTFNTSKRYDLILMNPPFHLNGKENSLISDVYDYDFIDRAFGLLKEGGRIVAITSTKWSFDKNWDEFELFKTRDPNYPPTQNDINLDMKKNKRFQYYTNKADYKIERLENEPFLGSNGKKIKMNVDLWIINKTDEGIDSDILGKVFYLSQQIKGAKLENIDIDFKKEQKEPEPPLPIQAPIEEVLEEPQLEIPKEESLSDLKTQMTQLILKIPSDKIIKVLNKLKYKGRMNTNKLLQAQQLQQNFNTIPKMKELIKALTELEGAGIDQSELKKFVDAGYKKKKDVKNIDGYVLDTELSTRRDKIYVDPKTGKAVHTISGTDSLKDWSNNLLIPFGLHSKTNRYKNAEETQKKANAKYGKQNVSVISHSQSGNIADNLAKRDLVGDENITLNPAIIGKPSKNVKVVKSYFDPVSYFTKTKKSDVVLKPTSINPLTEHSTKILGKGRKN